MFKKNCEQNTQENQNSFNSNKNVPVEDDSFLKSILNHESVKYCDSHLVKFFQDSEMQKLSMHYLAVNFNGNKLSVEEFLKFCLLYLNDEACTKAQQVTSNQNKNNTWFELRYARLTASNIYEAAQCKTLDGSLLEKIFGKNSFDNPAMKRGRKLENEVLSIIEKQLKKKFSEKVQKSGLILNKQYPMLGASPDGVTENSVIEIKCPFKEKTIKKYHENGVIKNRFKAQIQVQMLFARKSKGYFCIADPDFEKNRKITVIEESYDEKFTMAKKFWERNCFPHLMNSV